MKAVKLGWEIVFGVDRVYYAMKVGKHCQKGNQCKVMLDYTVFNGLIYYPNIRYNIFFLIELMKNF